jgi:hypothetical protein
MRAPTTRTRTPRKHCGKKNDPRFRRANLWIEKTVFFDAKRNTIGTGSDVSDLVTRLLRDWLKEQPVTAQHRRRR